MPAASASLRVHRLDVRAPERDDILPFRNDLEDALRTASFPMLPRGATLHIRKLTLGRFPRGVSRQALAALLERRLAETPVDLLRWGEPVPSGEAAAVVPDLVIAAALALESVFAGRPLHWALAKTFPDLPQSDESAATVRILDLLLQCAGAAALGRLALLPDGCDVLIRAFRAAPDAAVERWLAPATAALPKDLRTVLHDIWAETPPDGPSAAERYHTKPDRRQIAAAVSERSAPALKNALAVAIPAWGVLAPRTVLLAAWVSAGLSGPAVLPHVLRHLVHIALHPEATPRRTRPSEAADRPPATTGTSEAPAEAPPDRAEVPDADAEVQHTTPRQLGDLAVEPDIGGVPCERAGLWLLVPVLRLVGAEAAEEALQTSVCQDVMRAFADRSGLSGTGPMADLLAAALPAEPPDTNGHWVPHESVARGLAGKSHLMLRRSAPGRAALGLRHGPAGFAQASADDVRRLRDARVSLRPHGSRAAIPYPEIQISLILAVQRLVASLTGRGWRHLAKRRGRVLITPTHIDITYDGREADPAVRVAGLDIDPGWVPWLGRVVSFHYDYSQVRDFEPPVGLQ